MKLTQITGKSHPFKAIRFQQVAAAVHMVPIVADTEDTASRESRSDREGVSWKHKTDINVSRVLKT